jgi:hypothetical protein
VIIANPAAKQLFNQKNLPPLTMPEFLDTIEEEPREMLKAWAKGQGPAGQTNVKFERNHRTISANLASVILTADNEESVDAGHVVLKNKDVH